MNKYEIFGDPEYQLSKNRQIRLRTLVNIPLDSDVNYLETMLLEILRRLFQMSICFGIVICMRSRDLVCARLTLFNVRRGVEPARLLLEEFDEVFTDEWIDQRNLELLSPVEKKIAEKLKITYQSGNGQSLILVK